MTTASSTATDWRTALAAGQRVTVWKQFPSEITKSDGGKTYTFTISTPSVDREGDTLSADGWQLDTYRKNPVVLWAHDY